MVDAIGLSDDEAVSMLRRTGQPHVYWSLREISAALGSPVSRDLTLLTPEVAPNAEMWSTTYRDALRPWRLRRRDIPVELRAGRDAAD